SVDIETSAPVNQGVCGLDLASAASQPASPPHQTRPTTPLEAASVADLGQRPDENAVGEFAHEGQMGGADRSPDRWRQHRQSRGTMRCALYNRVSLETPVSGCSGRR